MPQASMQTVLQSRGDGAVGAFNVILIEHAEALVTAAEAAQLPIILQLSENCIKYHGRPDAIVAATLAIARSASTDVVVHLDHASNEELVRSVVALGVDSVMFDASTSPYEENVARTKALTAWGHERGVSMEAEIGEVGGKDGVHAPGIRTDPAEAAAFAAATNVDLLAVAVGSSHAKAERDLAVDVDLIERIAATVPLPLVLHGSSSLDDAQLQAAVRAGMAKINISTHVNSLFTNEVRRVLGDSERLSDPRKYIGPARSIMAQETERLLRLLAQPTGVLTA
ncbi:class II fructose-bisphosphate aldolase [Humidisolicoccus flavus]|uniref:class II fructose-bisphosphate aldolase n=1 Tax=Humidisolicoccus flavus TaxID=3111414 RepID=UPI003255B0D5